MVLDGKIYGLYYIHRLKETDPLRVKIGCVSVKDARLPYNCLVLTGGSSPEYNGFWTSIGSESMTVSLSELEQEELSRCTSLFLFGASFKQRLRTFFRVRAGSVWADAPDALVPGSLAYIGFDGTCVVEKSEPTCSQFFTKSRMFDQDSDGYVLLLKVPVRVPVEDDGRGVPVSELHGVAELYLLGSMYALRVMDETGIYCWHFQLHNCIFSSQPVALLLGYMEMVRSLQQMLRTFKGVTIHAEIDGIDRALFVSEVCEVDFKGVVLSPHLESALKPCRDLLPLLEVEL